MTNYKKLMMDVIEGKAAEFLPFAPRLEIWYRCNKINGTLPDSYRDANLLDIIDELDIGHNYMIPDFLQHGGIENTYSRGLGHLFSNTATVYNLNFEDIDHEATVLDGLTTCRYNTPYGMLQTSVLYDENMRRSGVTIPHKVERLIKSVQDYDAAAWLFERIKVVPCYELYNQYAHSMGNRTILNTLATQRSNGMHLLMMDLMEYDSYVYNSVDYPEETAALARWLNGYIDRCIAVCADSPALVITTGCHFDHILTGRPIFNEHFLPDLLRCSNILKEKGKFMACHTDSDNENLLDLYVECGISVADSICTKPLTQQSYRDIRKQTTDKITLFGLIPSVAVLPETMSDYDFDVYLDTLLNEIQQDGARNVILAIADTTPPGADVGRIRKIARLSRQVRPV